MGFLVGQAQCDFILEIGCGKGTNSGVKKLFRQGRDPTAESADQVGGTGFLPSRVISFPSLYISKTGRVWLSRPRNAAQFIDPLCDQENANEALARRGNTAVCQELSSASANAWIIDSKLAFSGGPAPKQGGLETCTDHC